MVRAARLLAYVVELRLRLPAWFDGVPLDALLRATEHPMGSAPLDDVLAATRRAESLAAKLGARDTCLYRALARRAALRAMGHPAKLVMGLRPDADDTEGHAWVELEGAVVDEELEHPFQVTFREV